MIRVYLDWGVISNLKKPESNELKDFIEKHKEYLQFPYSPAHFTDLMKSNFPGNELFNDDIETLEYLSKRHLIQWDGKRTQPYLATPAEYLQRITEQGPVDYEALMDIKKLTDQMDELGSETGVGNIGALFKSVFQTQPLGFEINETNKEYLSSMFPTISSSSTMWDFINEMGPMAKNILQNKEYYKNLRTNVNKVFKLEDNSGNWDVSEVIKNIDDYLKQYGVGMSFHEYISNPYKDRKEPVTRFEYFTSAYFTLDMIGYKSDRLPKKTDTGQNISTDAEHAFYGAHCDYFITSDKKLGTKAKVLYSTFNIPTVVLRPEEFISTIEKIVHVFPKNETIHFANEAVNHIDFSKVIEKTAVEEGNEVVALGYKLSLFYFNFFNYVAFQYYKEENVIILEFKKVFKNYSDFIYYTESERVISVITNFFGYEGEDLEERRNNFIYGENHEEFVWSFKNVRVVLNKDMETYRPTLIYAIKLENDLFKHSPQEQEAL